MNWLLPEDEGARKRRDRVLAFLAVVAMVLLVARAARKEAGVLVNNQEFGARFLDGDDPYIERATGFREHGPYPPSYVLVCAPLSLAPTRIARVGWALLQCAALAWLFVLTRRRLRDTWPGAAPHTSVVFAAAILLVSRFLLRDMAAGGGNLIYATLALTGLEFSARGKPGRAGFSMALGLVAKPNLALFSLFYLLRRRWRTLLWAGVLGGLLLCLPALHYGVSRYASLVQRWCVDVAAFSSLEDLHDPELVPAGMPLSQNAMNQSLREAVSRAMRPSQEASVPDVNLMVASPRAAAWAARLVSLALLLATIAVTLRSRTPRAAWLAGCSFFVLSLLLSPITWKAHCVALLPVFVALVAETFTKPRPRWLLGFLGVYYVVCDLGNEELFGKSSKMLLQAFSVVTWANVILLLLVLWLATRANQPEGLS